MIKDVFEWLQTQSKAASTFLILMLSAVLLLLIFAVIHSYTFSKEPRYVFGMKFGPEERFDDNYDPNEYYKFNLSSRADIKMNVAPTNSLRMTNKQCIDYAVNFMKSYEIDFDLTSSNYVFGYITPHSSTSATIGVRCSEWPTLSITDVDVISAGLSETTRSWAKQLDDGFEEDFEKAKVKLVDLEQVRQ